MDRGGNDRPDPSFQEDTKVTLRIPLLAGMKALSLAVSLALAPAPVLAAPDVAAQVSEQLTAQGYRQIEVRRTLLGKVVVTARGHGHRREIVIDPRNGALLRDLVRDEGGGGGRVSIARVGDPEDDGEDDAEDDGGKGDDDGDDGGNSGSSGGGGGDDDSGSDDDSGNSGSGGGDDRDDSGSDDGDSKND